jgi:hypothetical protein
MAFRLSKIILMTLALSSGGLPISVSASGDKNGPDLPPVGRSSFDLFISKIGGLPKDLTHTVSELGRVAGQEFSKTFLPFSRSLSRKETNFDNPRAVIVNSPNRNPADFEQYLSYSRISLGHVDSSGNYEVISFNEKLGRPEFQVVIKGKVYYARRDLCISCHQKENLLFPEPGWNETDFNSTNREKILAGKYFQQHPQDWLSGSRGAPDLDQQVKAINSYLDGQRLWRYGCGSNPAVAVGCRKLLLEAHFNSVLTIPAKHRLTHEEAFGVPAKPGFFSKLLNRPPSDEPLFERTLIKNWPKSGIYLRLNTSIKDRSGADLTNDGPLPADLDPKTPRRGIFVVPELEAGKLIFKDVKTGNKVDEVSLFTFMFAMFDKEETTEFVQKIGGRNKFAELLAGHQLDNALSENTFNLRSLILASYQATGVDTKDVEYPENIEKQLPPPVLATDAQIIDPEASQHLKRVENPASSHVQSLRKYCQECHVGKEDTEFNFMNGNDAEITQRLKDNPNFLLERIISRLSPEPDHQMMPPPTSTLGQEFRKNAKAIRNLTDALTTLKFDKATQCISTELHDHL